MDTSSEAVQIDVLCAFYAKFDPEKTATEVAAILTKRKKGASVLPANQFDELCSKLEKKYGEAPADTWRSSQQKQEVEDMVEESTHSDQIDTLSEAVQIDVLRAFYRKFDPEKTATEVASILIKRKKGASVLSGKQFEELCGKLEQKYGEAPADVWRESQQKPPEDNAAPSDSDDDYSEAFDDGIMPMRSPQQACVREPDPEPALSREEAARRRKELMAEIEKTEKTMFSWESIVASQTENREYLQQSLDGLTKRLSDLRTEFAALETMYSRASSGQHARSGVWCNVVESTVIHAPVPQVWSAIKAMDFAWSSTVSTVRDCVAPMAGRLGTAVLDWSDGLRWAISVDHLSDQKWKLVFKVSSADGQLSALLPASVKIKLRRVSALHGTLVEWTTRLPSGSSSSDVTDAHSRAAAALADLRRDQEARA